MIAERSFVAHVLPGQTVTLKTELLNPAQMRDVIAGGKPGVLELGVLTASFSDRREWRFPIAMHARFSNRPIRMPSTGARYCNGLISRVVYAAFSDPLLECVEGENDTMCNQEDDGASCSERVCEDGEECSRDECRFIIEDD